MAYDSLSPMATAKDSFPGHTENPIVHEPLEMGDLICELIPLLFYFQIKNIIRESNFCPYFSMHIQKVYMENH